MSYELFGFGNQRVSVRYREIIPPLLVFQSVFCLCEQTLIENSSGQYGCLKIVIGLSQGR